MGFKVTTMHNVPAVGMEYYVYVLEPSWSHCYKDWFDSNFDSIGKELGADAALVQGWDEQLTHELVNFVAEWSANSEEGNVLERTAFSMVSLIVSQGDIYQTNEPIIWIPIADPDKSSEDGEKFLSAMMETVVGAIKDGDIQKFAIDTGAVEIPLRGVRQGLLFNTLRYLNNVLQLQPNIAGIGANLNAAIEPLLEGTRRD